MILRHLLATILLYCATTANAEDFLDAKKAAEWVEKNNAILIDIREESELSASGMAKPAIWIAKSDIDSNSQKFKTFLKETNKDKKIIMYCRSGGRVSRTLPKITAAGFKAYNIGGFSHWKDAGLPVQPYKHSRAN